MNKKLINNRRLTFIVIIAIIILSCRLPRAYLTLENQTAYDVRILVDTLFLMTMKPYSIEKCVVTTTLPPSLYIKSPSIEDVRIDNPYLFDSIVGTDTFFNYIKFKAQIDDSIISEYDLFLRPLFDKKNPTLVFTDKGLILY